MTNDDFMARPTSRENGGSKVKRKGPPNRMNDLAYRDWMKFQKSFFRFTSDESLITECIQFFTKATWPDGSVSRTVVIGACSGPPREVDPRLIEEHLPPSSAADYLSCLNNIDDSRCDFILVDLRAILDTKTGRREFLELSDRFFASVRRALRDDRYCCFISSDAGVGAGMFPTPWAIGLAGRAHLRLRDERIGLRESDEPLIYCLFMQASDDKRPPFIASEGVLQVAETGEVAPSWTIPKPPARLKNEILHPAKYPETLVSEFLEIFSNTGDSILDPMVGTGSTVVAALRSGRNGFGLDLNPSYVKVALERARHASQPKLDFDDRPVPFYNIIEHDASKLDSIAELTGRTFQYCVTSPPYWSMLSNPGSENQDARRKQNLVLVYSEHESDLGNEKDYDRFLNLLENVYEQVAGLLDERGVLTVVVKNVKREHIVYPLAWDLAFRLSRPGGNYEFAGYTAWCQDDIGLKPFAVGIHWVSNILHHYCLHFRRRFQS